MYYATKHLQLRQHKVGRHLYNLRLFDAPPRNFEKVSFFTQPKYKNITDWQQPIYKCLSCNSQINSKCIADTIQNSAAGGPVELELYQCPNCGKFTMVEHFED